MFTKGLKPQGEFKKNSTGFCLEHYLLFGVKASEPGRRPRGRANAGAEDSALQGEPALTQSLQQLGTRGPGPETNFCRAR